MLEPYPAFVTLSPSKDNTFPDVRYAANLASFAHFCTVSASAVLSPFPFKREALNHCLEEPASILWSCACLGDSTVCAIPYDLAKTANAIIDASISSSVATCPLLFFPS